MSQPSHMLGYSPAGEGVASSAATSGAPARCEPTLPPGYTTQPDIGFRDSTGQLVYALHRVYGGASLPELDEVRGAATRLVEDLCYWAVSWDAGSYGEDKRSAGRWVTFAEARARGHADLTFRRFCSLDQMRAALPAMLRVDRPSP